MNIIEFCGNPGCGKSTIASSLICRMRELGTDIHDYNDVKEKKVSKHFGILLSPTTFRNFITFLKFGCRSKISKRTFVYSAKCAVVLSQLQKWHKNGRFGTVVFDEGIIQYLTTLSHNKTIEDLNSFDFLREFYQYDNVFVINCELDVQENIRRLNTRNRAGDRFVLPNEEIQIGILKTKRNNLNTVLQLLRPKNSICILTDEDTSTVVNSLVERWSVKDEIN